ncbi:MAG TPA: ASKHA domain-containing protein [Syntrophorhabdaceae bacterium]|jgi:uncharacterized 2Fe-2S/4Fe-4S cluster protein (DUF4445 family)
MARVKFLPNDVTIDVNEQVTILDAARLAGVRIESPCNGTGKCGKCRVTLDDGETPVLACTTVVRDGVSVHVVEEDNRSLEILSHANHVETSVDPYIRKIFVATEGRTLVYGGAYLLGSEKGDGVDKNYGVVVDIGTTTLVASLVDLTGGHELGTASSLNPQAIHAQDVLSRITFCAEPEGMDIMFGEFAKEVNRLVGEVSTRAGIDRENIYEAVYSGNTCMLHLATGTNPRSLGRYPYTPALTGGQVLSAEEMGLRISKYGLVYLPPVISGFVGADITSGILATRLHERKGKTLFVDIGTNGEMVLSVDGTLVASSTAAGPAFEGMNITFGMRAERGAVEEFSVTERGVSLKTIGNAAVRGICGSGLLDIVGELVAHRVIDDKGKLVDPANGIYPFLKDRLGRENDKPVFYLSPGVYLSQKDVRQVQLAKGAVRTGIEFLLRHGGITARDVDEVLIAGSFGYHLREESLISTGLLPAEFRGKVEFVGNTSKSGGHVFLVNKEAREEITTLVKGINVLELANYPDFDKVFVKSLGFHQEEWA